jgi:hypothetical protein
MAILRPGDPGDIDVPALLPAWLCANLVVDMESARCQSAAREIDREHPGRGAASRGAARHRRGVIARVEREDCPRRDLGPARDTAPGLFGPRLLTPEGKS